MTLFLELELLSQSGTGICWHSILQNMTAFQLFDENNQRTSALYEQMVKVGKCTFATFKIRIVT